MNHQHRIHNIAQICVQHGLVQAIISPGSRSAPLTAAFAQHPEIKSRVVMDERAAAFIALGLAQQTRQPVALICTSGTAGLNYAPAITEAFYQNLPLLILTADRPPEWIDQQDNQTSHQTQLYGAHVRASFTLPVETNHPDAAWHLQRLVAEALNRTLSPLPGPVHLNIPLREPLYPTPDEPVAYQTDSPTIHQPEIQATLSQATWHGLMDQWQYAETKLILAGANYPDERLSAALETLAADAQVVLVADIAANIQPVSLRHTDLIMSRALARGEASLRPDLLLSLGGPMVSKALKLYLRQASPRWHWRLDPAGAHIDTYQNLTHVMAVDPVYFLAKLAALQPSAPNTGTAPTDQTYSQNWATKEEVAQAYIDAFLTEIPFGEFLATAMIMAALPEDSQLQLGNSMPVRYASYLGLPERPLRVFANRGTSGIDGTVSTAVGAALATPKMTTLIVGDLGFFYDRNGLWHNHLPPNLRIVVLNNHGGGIFRLIEGPGNLPQNILETYFDTPHPLSARNTALDHGCAYFYADQTDALNTVLPQFFAPDLGPAILEIETDMQINTDIFQRFKRGFKEMIK